MIRILPALLLCAWVFQDVKPCDLSKSERGLYCEGCMRTVTKEDLTRKSECKVCKKKATKITICVKTYYRCPDCFSQSWKKGICRTQDCAIRKIERGEHTVKAAIFYRCPGSCRSEAWKKGRCGKEGCSKRKKSLERTCRKSGQFPHTKEKD